MNWSWDVVSDFMPLFWDGVVVTLQALALGTLIAFSLGLVWAIAQRSRFAFVRWPVSAITEFIRNTPSSYSCSSCTSWCPSGVRPCPR